MTVSFVTVQAVALDTYIVKYGDILSTIIKQHYPQDRLYGANEKLGEVLKQNPHIKNSDPIYPNQKIYFATVEVNNSIVSLHDKKTSSGPEDVTCPARIGPEYMVDLG